MKRYRCTEKVNCDQALEAMKDGVNIIELREKYAKREVFENLLTLWNMKNRIIYNLIRVFLLMVIQNIWRLT